MANTLQCLPPHELAALAGVGNPAADPAALAATALKRVPKGRYLTFNPVAGCSLFSVMMQIRELDRETGAEW